MNEKALAWAPPAGAGPEPPLNADGEALHSGDDERIDTVTSIHTAVSEVIDELNGHGEIADTLRGVLDDCLKLDALIIATIKRERANSAEPPADPVVQGIRDQVRAFDYSAYATATILGHMAYLLAILEQRDGAGSAPPPDRL